MTYNLSPLFSLVWPAKHCGYGTIFKHATPYIVRRFVILLLKMSPTNSSATCYLKTIIKWKDKHDKKQKLRKAWTPKLFLLSCVQYCLARKELTRKAICFEVCSCVLKLIVIGHSLHNQQSWIILSGHAFLSLTVNISVIEHVKNNGSFHTILLPVLCNFLFHENRI